jgi:hypothetical protein
MALPGPLLEALVAVIKDAFNRDSLGQLVRFKLGADMYKEWVPDGQPFKTDVFNLLTTLEREGLLAGREGHEHQRPDGGDQEQRRGHGRQAAARARA